MKQKTIRFSLFLMAVSFLSGTHAITFRYATIAPQGSIWAKNAQAMKKDIEKSTNGRVRLQIFYGGVAGEETTVLKKLRAGLVDMASFTGIALGTKFPEVRILELPMFFENERQVDAVVRELYPYFEKQFSKKGFVLAGWGESGFVYLLSKKPVRKVEDMNGRKIWAPKGDKLVQTMLSEFGLIPVYLGFESVLPQLQTGGLEAVYGPPMGVIGLQWFRYVKYYADIKLAHGTGATLISKRSYKKLNAKDQKTVKALVKKYSRKLVLSLRKENIKGLRILRKRGVIRTVVPKKGAALLKRKSDIVAKKLIGKMYSRKLLNRAIRAKKSVK